MLYGIEILELIKGHYNGEQGDMSVAFGNVRINPDNAHSLVASQ